MNDLINTTLQQIKDFAGDFANVESVIFRDGNLVRRSASGVETVIPLGNVTETDPTVPSHVKSITTTNISNWNTAFGWGNHATAGYLTTAPTLAQVTTAGNTTTNNITVGSTFAVGDWTSRPTNVYVRAATGGADERGYYIGVGSANNGNGGSLTYNATTNFLSLKSPYNSGTIALSLEGNTNSVQFHNTSGTVVSKFVSSTGNLLIGTTTDAGYKLDVNGTARIQGNSLIKTSNTANNVIGFEVQNSAASTAFQIFNDGQARFYSNVTYYSTITVNDILARNIGLTFNTNGTRSTNFIGNVTAASALARGVFFNNTLVAAANNDVLVGLDINPTFTNGAFTGVENIDLRTKGTGLVVGSGVGYGATYGYANDGIIQVKANGTGGSGFGYATQLWLRPSGNPGGYNAQYWSFIEQTANGLHFQSGRYASNITLRAGRDASSGNVYFNNAFGTMAMLFGATANMTIGTTTDAGYKLDVNGTTRVTSLYTANIYPVASSINLWVNSLNAASRFYTSPVHQDGRINFNAVAGGSDQVLIRAWHTGSFALGTGSSSAGGALTVRGDSLLVGTSGSLYFMAGTFGPVNVPYRLGITTDATTTYFSTGVGNNLTNIESHAFSFTAKSHTFYTGTTAGNQGNPNQYTPLHLSTLGNVVIGSTTDAGYKLDVNGTARFSGQIAGSNGLSITGGNIISQTGANSGRMTMLNLRNTGGGFQSAVGTSLAIAFTNREVAGVWTDDVIENIVHSNAAGAVTTGYNFYTHNNQSYNASPVLAMSINGLNVGIGIPTPTAKLHVSGDIKATLASTTTANVVYYDSSTGLLTYGAAPAGGGGSSSALKSDYTYDITGIKNGINTVFSTTVAFVSGTTRVYLNGVRLTPGTGYDYQETSTNQITMAFAPEVTDQITIDYQPL